MQCMESVNPNLSYEETYKYSNLSTLYYLDRQSKIHAKSYQWSPFEHKFLFPTVILAKLQNFILLSSIYCNIYTIVL